MRKHDSSSIVSTVTVVKTQSNQPSHKSQGTVGAMFKCDRGFRKGHHLKDVVCPAVNHQCSFWKEVGHFPRTEKCAKFDPNYRANKAAKKQKMSHANWLSVVNGLDSSLVVDAVQAVKSLELESNVSPSRTNVFDDPKLGNKIVPSPCLKAPLITRVNKVKICSTKAI